LRKVHAEPLQPPEPFAGLDALGGHRHIEAARASVTIEETMAELRGRWLRLLMKDLSILILSNGNAVR
jgi:hypothetical protein